MGLQDCEILLDNPFNTYYAGQTINGQVKLGFDSSKKIRGISIRFLGEANTTWSETVSRTNSEGRSENETVTLKGHEEYFRIQYYLVGGKNSPQTELPAGKHTFPFTCALPPALPSSFEGEYGHIRYTIKITLDRPWKFDQDMKMAFTVISPVDLNANPRVKEPYKLVLEKSFCCMCCRSGPLSVVTFVPVTGYVSGQTIPITCECDNASDVTIQSVKFVLRKRVTYRTTEPHSDKKEDKIIIAELGIGPVGGTESRTFSQQLQIPPLPPTNLMNCGIIALDYELHIECGVSGPHRNLTGNIPIILGTIPLASFQPPTDAKSQVPTTQLLEPLLDPSMAPTQPASPASPLAHGGAMGWNVADSAGAQLFPNMPPPQFLESQFKALKITSDADSEHTRIVGGSSFSPRYPSFQFNPTAPPQHTM